MVRLRVLLDKTMVPKNFNRIKEGVRVAIIIGIALRALNNGCYF